MSSLDGVETPPHRCIENIKYIMLKMTAKSPVAEIRIQFSLSKEDSCFKTYPRVRKMPIVAYRC